MCSGTFAFVFRFTMTAVPPSAQGICRQPLHAVIWSGVNGASDAPKSTVRFVIAWIPPPEPIGW